MLEPLDSRLRGSDGMQIIRGSLKAWLNTAYRQSGNRSIHDTTHRKAVGLGHVGSARSLGNAAMAVIQSPEPGAVCFVLSRGPEEGMLTQQVEHAGRGRDAFTTRHD